MSTATDSGTSAQADAPEPGDPEPATPAGRPFPTAWVSAALVVGLLLGLAAGLLAPQLTRPGDTSAEAGFTRDMIRHHSQAVSMGLLAYGSSGNAEVRQVAVDVASSQQGELGMMQAWLKGWGLNPTGSTPPMSWMPDGAASVRNGLMPGMASAEEMAQLRAATGRELDLLFLKLMITHHLGAIHMVDAVLGRTDEDALREAATTMKNTQQNDLANLTNLQKRLGG